jgi:hypothetical protein
MVAVAHTVLEACTYPCSSAGMLTSPGIVPTLTNGFIFCSFPGSFCGVISGLPNHACWHAHFSCSELYRSHVLIRERERDRERERERESAYMP